MMSHLHLYPNIVRYCKISWEEPVAGGSSAKSVGMKFPRSAIRRVRRWQWPPKPLAPCGELIHMSHINTLIILLLQGFTQSLHDFRSSMDCFFRWFVPRLNSPIKHVLGSLPASTMGETTSATEAMAPCQQRHTAGPPQSLFNGADGACTTHQRRLSPRSPRLLVLKPTVQNVRNQR